MDNLKLNESFQELNVDELADIDGGNRLVNAFGDLTRILSSVMNVTLPDLGERRNCTNIVDCAANTISTVSNIGNWVRSFRQ